MSRWPESKGIASNRLASILPRRLDLDSYYRSIGCNAWKPWDSGPFLTKLPIDSMKFLLLALVWHQLARYCLWERRRERR